MNLEEVGDITFTYCNVLRWAIPSFQISEQQTNNRIWSPLFSKPGDLPYCRLIPYSLTYRRKIPEGFVSLLVYSEDHEYSPSKCLQFGVLNDESVEIKRFSGERCQYNNLFIVLEFMRLDALKGQFRVFCEVMNESRSDIVNASSTGKQNCEKKDAAVQTTENKESENHSSKQWSISSQRNLEKLSQNLKDLFMQQKNTDMVFMVKDQEFKAHKGILMYRSQVFNAMFTHELTERKSGIVPIEDCEPAVFEEFLLFVYSGKTEHLSSGNVCELYYVSDKYQILELIEECVEFLKKSLSIETICDVICLSMKHNEKELLELATTFFSENMEEILVTVKWQLFMKENSVAANELIIKALNHGFTKINK